MATTDDTAREVLNEQAASDFLAVTPGTVRRYARQGLLPAYRVGKSLRFLRSDLLEFLRSSPAFRKGVAVTATARAMRAPINPKKFAATQTTPEQCDARS